MLLGQNDAIFRRQGSGDTQAKLGRPLIGGNGFGGRKFSAIDGLNSLFSV